MLEERLDMEMFSRLHLYTSRERSTQRILPHPNIVSPAGNDAIHRSSNDTVR